MNTASHLGPGPESPGGFRLGDLRVFPAAGRIDGPGGTEQVDPKVMAVFELLARSAGELVTRDRLLESVWEGRVVSDDVVSRCIYQLRRHLARAGGRRSYRGLVKTLPKRGYLLEAGVQPLDEMPAAPRSKRMRARVIAAIVALATTAVAFWLNELAEPESSAATTGAATAAPTVAVLPFTDLSAEADHAWFTDGISEEIIGRLAAYRELRVIGRTSSFALRDSGYGSREISDLLGAQFLLEGSVRKHGESVRITAQLVDRDGVYLWGATFDRELREIFAIQREIAQVVATSILPRVATAAPASRQPDIEAYREYLIGKDLLARRTGLFFDKPVELFSRSIEIDPGFAEAYAARAVGLFFRSRTVDGHDEQMAQAWQDVETALSLDPELAEAYATKALLMERTDPSKVAEREALLTRALELDPTLPDAWNWLGGVRFQQERYAEAEQAVLQAARINPLAPVINVNLALNDARRGRVADATRRLERLLRIPQPSPMVYTDIVKIYAGSGRFGEALAAAKALVLSVSPSAGRAAWTFPLIDVYARLGMTEPALYWLERSRREASPSYFQHQLFVLFLARDVLGHDETLARFDEVLEGASLGLDQLSTERRANYGQLLALTDDHARAIALLESLLAVHDEIGSFEYDIEARHTLAWSLQQTGEPARAAAILRDVETHFNTRQRHGFLQFGDDLAPAALNALLLGDTQAAHRYLEQAVEAGWRGYHEIAGDPRWDTARAEPALRNLLTRMKADVDRQRAEIEAFEDHRAFVAQVDAVIAAGSGRERQP